MQAPFLLPVVFHCHLARASAQAQLHIALLEQGPGVIDHLRVAAQHHPRMLRGQWHAGGALQFAVFDQVGNAPVEAARMLFAGHGADELQLVGDFRQVVALHQLAEHLLERETITGEEFMEMLKKVAPAAAMKLNS